MSMSLVVSRRACAMNTSQNSGGICGLALRPDHRLHRAEHEFRRPRHRQEAARRGRGRGINGAARLLLLGGRGRNTKEEAAHRGRQRTHHDSLLLEGGRYGARQALTCARRRVTTIRTMTSPIAIPRTQPTILPMRPARSVEESQLVSPLREPRTELSIVSASGARAPGPATTT